MLTTSLDVSRKLFDKIIQFEKEYDYNFFWVKCFYEGENAPLRLRTKEDLEKEDPNEIDEIYPALLLSELLEKITNQDFLKYYIENNEFKTGATALLTLDIVNLFRDVNKLAEVLLWKIEREGK